jgi:3-oxoacyl-[acyl-carrier protein] reductase
MPSRIAPSSAAIGGLYSRVVAAPHDDTFSGRVALVTGGSGGIGAAIVRALADAGAAVAVGYGRRREAAESLALELRERGVRAAAFGADLEDPAGPSQLVRQVEGELGAVDVLVANHGHARPVNYEDLDAAAFDRTMAVNLRAPFLLAQKVLPGMRGRRFGRILFVSSLAAFRGGVVGPDYAASKAGLHGIAFFLASRAASDGVTVNAIAPGFVETPMLPGTPDELGKGIPIGRVGRPEEVADLALAMLRNAYLTAHVFPIDGGSFPR